MHEKLESLVISQRDRIQQQCAYLISLSIEEDFRNQFERASRSIANNFHEGYGCKYLGEKIKFFNYAKRSTREVLGMTSETWYEKTFVLDDITELRKILTEIDHQLFYLIRSLEKRNR
ncbi:MAG: four helix bundle protein [Flavobacteriia bacterium]|nr:four helix bundle protein [Flavobacteriia bacterium]